MNIENNRKILSAVYSFFIDNGNEKAALSLQDLTDTKLSLVKKSTEIIRESLNLKLPFKPTPSVIGKKLKDKDISSLPESDSKLKATAIPEEKPKVAENNPNKIILKSSSSSSEESSSSEDESNSKTKIEKVNSVPIKAFSQTIKKDTLTKSVNVSEKNNNINKSAKKSSSSSSEDSDDTSEDEPDSKKKDNAKPAINVESVPLNKKETAKKPAVLPGKNVKLNKPAKKSSSSSSEDSDDTSDDEPDSKKKNNTKPVIKVDSAPLNKKETAKKATVLTDKTAKSNKPAKKSSSSSSEDSDDTSEDEPDSKKKNNTKPVIKVDSAPLNKKETAKKSVVLPDKNMKLNKSAKKSSSSSSEDSEDTSDDETDSNKNYSKNTAIKADSAPLIKKETVKKSAILPDKNVKLNKSAKKSSSSSSDTSSSSGEEENVSKKSTAPTLIKKTLTVSPKKEVAAISATLTEQNKKQVKTAKKSSSSSSDDSDDSSSSLIKKSTSVDIAKPIPVIKKDCVASPKKAAVASSIKPTSKQSTKSSDSSEDTSSDSEVVVDVTPKKQIPAMAPKSSPLKSVDVGKSKKSIESSKLTTETKINDVSAVTKKTQLSSASIVESSSDSSDSDDSSSISAKKSLDKSNTKASELGTSLSTGAKNKPKQSLPPKSLVSVIDTSKNSNKDSVKIASESSEDTSSDEEIKDVQTSVKVAPKSILKNTSNMMDKPDANSSAIVPSIGKKAKELNKSVQTPARISREPKVEDKSTKTVKSGVLDSNSSSDSDSTSDEELNKSSLLMKKSTLPITKLPVLPSKLETSTASIKSNTKETKTYNLKNSTTKKSSSDSDDSSSEENAKTPVSQNLSVQTVASSVSISKIDTASSSSEDSDSSADDVKEASQNPVSALSLSTVVNNKENKRKKSAPASVSLNSSKKVKIDEQNSVNVDISGNTKTSLKSTPKFTFQRIKTTIDQVPHDLRNNKFQPLTRNEFGTKASESFENVKGRQYKHEKTKRKKGSLAGMGAINTESRGYKFEETED